MISHRLKKMF